MSGPAELFDGVSGVYDIVLANDGAAATGTAQITIYAAGGLDPHTTRERTSGW